MAHINLLPWRENLRKQRQRDFYKHLGAGLAVALGLVVAGHMYAQSEIDAQERRNTFLQETISELDKQITEIKQIKETRANLVARMEVIQNLQATRSHIVHVYDELARTLPDGIVLTNVSLKNGQILEINGMSDSAARVADYLRNLNTSTWLGHASIVGSGILAQSDKPASGGKPVKSAFKGEYAFFITAQFTPPASNGDAAAQEGKKP